MNTQLKTILLTILSLSLFTIALVELSGVSSKALFNKYGIGSDGHNHNDKASLNDPFATSNAPATTMPTTSITFETLHHNFGKIKEGTIAKHAFKFTNTGNHPLLISDVQVGCGCTVPSYSKEPVLSGQTGEVSIEFNSSNRPGANHKNVKILSNIEGGQTEVTFDAEVVK
jgi:hypothetical protein